MHHEQDGFGDATSTDEINQFETDKSLLISKNKSHTPETRPDHSIADSRVRKEVKIIFLYWAC